MPFRLSRRRTWPAAVLGGVAGTAAMTATIAAAPAVDPGDKGLSDYDATWHVTTAASKVLRWQPHTDAQRTALFNVVHWGYGSAVAIQYDELRRRLGSDVAAAAAFYVVCQATAFVLFPLLGDTPPPWKWRRNVLLTSLGEHALYAAVVAGVSRALRARRV